MSGLPIALLTRSLAVRYRIPRRWHVACVAPMAVAACC